MADSAEPERHPEPYVPPPDHQAPAKQASRWRKAGIAIGVMIALVAGIFGLATLTGDEGEGTPEAAVQKLVDALVQEDVLGALEALVPGERSLLRGRVVELTAQLERLGIVDERMDLARVPGADFAVDGLELTAERLGEDVAVVRADAGTARLRIMGAELPIGPLLEGQLDDPASISSPPAADLAGEDVMLVAVRRDGTWFVSLGYTVAELARRDGRAPVPRFGQGVTPKGASSPEAAVRELAAAAAAFDVRRAIELTPPGEADALHDYAPLFLPAAERGAAELRRDGVRAEVPTLELDVDSTGGREANVTITSLALNVTTREGRFGFTYDGRCAMFTGPHEEVLPGMCRDDANGKSPFADSAFSSFEVTVVERDGGWFVSPSGSLLDAAIGSLREFDREKVAKVVEEDPSELYALFLPAPFLYGAPFLVGGYSSDTKQVCASSTLEGTSDTENVAEPCVAPEVSHPAAAAPSRVQAEAGIQPPGRQPPTTKEDP